MKIPTFLSLALALMATAVCGIHSPENLQPANQSETNPPAEYTLVYFAEAWNYTRIMVTHPNGKRDRHDRRYRRKEAHAIGNYAMLMPILNQLAAKGFTIKSQSVTFQMNENFDHSLHHVYVLEKLGE